MPRCWDDVDEAAIQEQARRLVGDAGQQQGGKAATGAKGGTPGAASTSKSAATTPRESDTDKAGEGRSAAVGWADDMLGLGYVSRYGELEFAPAARLGGVRGRLSQSTDRRRSIILQGLDVLSAGPRSSMKDRDVNRAAAAGRLASSGAGPEVLQAASSSFDPDVYLAVVHANTSARQIAESMEALRGEMRERTGQLKDLVKDNFERFISCKNTIDTIHSKLVERERYEANASSFLGGTASWQQLSEQGGARDGQGQKHSRSNSLVEVDEQSALAHSVGGAHEEALRVFTPLLDRQAQAERIKSALGVLRRQSDVCSLPHAIRAHAAAGRLDELVKDYRKVITTCPRDDGMAERADARRVSVHAGASAGTRLLGLVRADADAAVDGACDALAAALESASVGPAEAARALRLLREVAAARRDENAAERSSSRRLLAAMAVGSGVNAERSSSTYGSAEEARLVDAYVAAKAARIEARIKLAAELDGRQVAASKGAAGTSDGGGGMADPVAAGLALTDVLANDVTEWWRAVQALRGEANDAAAGLAVPARAGGGGSASIGATSPSGAFAMTVDYEALLSRISGLCAQHLAGIVEELSTEPTRGEEHKIGGEGVGEAVCEGDNNADTTAEAATDAEAAAAVARISEILQALVAACQLLSAAGMPEATVGAFKTLRRRAAEGTVRRAFSRAVRRLEALVEQADPGAWQALSLEAVISTSSGGASGVEGSLFRVSALPVLAREACLEAARAAAFAVRTEAEVAPLARQCVCDCFHSMAGLLESLRPVVENFGSDMRVAAELAKAFTQSTLVLLSDVAFCRTQLVPDLVGMLIKLLAAGSPHAAAGEMAAEMTDGVDDALMALEETMMEAYLNLKVPAIVLAVERFARADTLSALPGNAGSSSASWVEWPPPPGVRSAAFGLTDLLVEAHAEAYAHAEPFANVVVGAMAVDLVRRAALALGPVAGGLAHNARLQLLVDAAYLQVALADHQADDLDAAFAELRATVGGSTEETPVAAEARDISTRLVPEAIERTRLNVAALRVSG